MQYSYIGYIFLTLDISFLIAQKQRLFGNSKQARVWPHTAKQGGGVDGKYFNN